MRKSKRVLAILSVVVIVATSLLSTNINALAEVYTGDCGENLTWTFKTVSGKLTISGAGEMYDYWYDGDERAPWEKYNNYTSPITSLIVNEGVTSIGARAFYGSHFIESISLPDSLVKIGIQAFQGCKIQKLVIPDSVTELGSSAFIGCGNLTDIHLGTGITKIPPWTFDYNVKLTEFTVPDTITEIGQGAFRDCYKLETFKFGKNVKTTQSEVFRNCSALKELYIPKGFESMGPYSFDGCTSLKDIYYYGSEDDWNDIDIHTDITSFISKNNVVVHFNYSDGENVNEPSTEPTTAPSTAPSTEPTTEPSTEPSTEPMTEPTTIPTTKPTTKPATTSCPHSLTKIKVLKKATLKDNGKKQEVCSKCGKVISTSTIKYAKSFTISKSTYTYTGKTLTKPTVTIKDSAGKKINTNNYTVSYISRSDNKNISKLSAVGQYKVKVVLKGEYSGTNYLYFSVKPKTLILKTLSTENRAVTAKWAKDTSISGYQIVIATDSKFNENKKIVNINKNSATSYKFSKLKKGKKYYIKARSYKIIKVDGKTAKIYGSYSSIKNIKCK